MRALRMTGAFLGLGLALAACQPRQIYADQGYVRLPAVKGQPAAAYFTVHGGTTDTALISVSNDKTIRTEMHESMTKGGMTSMKPLSQIPLPAGGKITFAPGGKHVMMYDVNPAVKVNEALALILTFADGTRIEYDAKVIGAGDPPPK